MFSGMRRHMDSVWDNYSPADPRHYINVAVKLLTIRDIKNYKLEYMNIHSAPKKNKTAGTGDVARRNARSFAGTMRYNRSPVNR